MKKDVALSLSGGGARGFFHLGVLQGLEELEIQPTKILGTSAGALAAAFYALGMKPEEIARSFFDFDFWRILRLSFTTRGLISTRPVFKALKDYFPDDDFRSLKIPVTIACTNFRKGEIRYFNSGPLLSPLIASIAIPAIFEPVEIEGEYYVDGGPLDNLPVHGVDKKRYYLIGSNANVIGPVEKSLNIISATERAFFLAVSGNVKSSKKNCDLFLEHPEMSKYRASDLKYGQEMIQLGLDAVHSKKDVLLGLK